MKSLLTNDSSVTKQLFQNNDEMTRKLEETFQHLKCKIEKHDQKEKVKKKQEQKTQMLNKTAKNIIQVTIDAYNVQLLDKWNYFIAKCAPILSKQVDKRMKQMQQIQNDLQLDSNSQTVENDAKTVENVDVELTLSDTKTINSVKDMIMAQRLILYDGDIKKAMSNNCQFCFEFAGLGRDMCDHSEKDCNLKHDEKFSLEYLSKDEKNYEKMFALWLIIDPIADIKLFKTRYHIWMGLRLFYYAKFLFYCNVNTNFIDNDLVEKCIYWLSFCLYCEKLDMSPTGDPLIETHSMLGICYSKIHKETTVKTDNYNMKARTHFELSINYLRPNLLNKVTRVSTQNAWINYVMFLHETVGDENQCLSLLEEMIYTCGAHMTNYVLTKIFELMNEIIQKGSQHQGNNCMYDKLKELIVNCDVDIYKNCIVAMSLHDTIEKLCKEFKKTQFSTLNKILQHDRDNCNESKSCMINNTGTDINHSFANRLESVIIWFKKQNSSNDIVTAFLCFCQIRSMICGIKTNNDKHDINGNIMDIINKIGKVVNILSFKLSKMSDLENKKFKNNNKIPLEEVISGDDTISQFCRDVAVCCRMFVCDYWDMLNEQHKCNLRESLCEKLFVLATMDTGPVQSLFGFRQLDLINMFFKLGMNKMAYYITQQISDHENPRFDKQLMCMRNYCFLMAKMDAFAQASGIHGGYSAKTMMLARWQLHSGGTHGLEDTNFKNYGYFYTDTKGCDYNCNKYPIGFCGVPTILSYCRVTNNSFGKTISLANINNNNLAPNTRRIIRTIRSSLTFYRDRTMCSPANVLDNLHWQQYAGLSIGIISLLTIKCTLFDINCNNYYKNFGENKLVKYLNRFVIENIEKNLQFPLTLDHRLTMFAHYCLTLCYFVIGNGTKFRKSLKKFNQRKVYEMDGAKALQRITESNRTIIDSLKFVWFDPCLLKTYFQSNKRKNNVYNQRRRLKLFASVMTKLRNYGSKYWCQNQGNMIISILDEQTRNKQDYLKWKNVIFDKRNQCDTCGKSCDEYQLRICKRCKNAHYCSKKCQKFDWNRGHHKYQCNHVYASNLSIA